MADTPVTSSSEPRTPPSSASEQARIRKERREAKIRAGGSARLDKITGLGGGIPRDAPQQPPAQEPSATAHADPDEVDISQHFYEPTRSTRSSNANAPFPTANQQLDENALRQMMLGFDTPTPSGSSNPFGMPGAGGMPGMGMPTGAGGPGAEDPMMVMLQQMMAGGGMTSSEGGAGAMPGFSGLPGMPGAAVSEEPYAYVWRIVHAVFAVGFGLFIALTTPFTGTRAARDVSAVGYGSGEGADAGLSLASVQFFWVFATAEVLLQTSRFFVEKGRVQQGAVMGMISGFLPEPYKGYLSLISRYSRIWTTVSADAMALVFVLGACAWWRSV